MSTHSCIKLKDAAAQCTTLARIESCPRNIKLWMHHNMLKLDVAQRKTLTRIEDCPKNINREVMLFSSRHNHKSMDTTSVNVGNSSNFRLHGM